MHRAQGVRVLAGRTVSQFETRDGRLGGVHLDDGTHLPCDVVLVAIGSLPNTEWLQGSGLVVDDGRGRHQRRCQRARCHPRAAPAYVDVRPSHTAQVRAALEDAQAGKYANLRRGLLRFDHFCDGRNRAHPKCTPVNTTPALIARGEA